MRVVSRTSSGLVRPNNEDCLLVRQPDLFAIADGMGGESAGEVASFETVKMLERIQLRGLGDEAILSNLSAAIDKINTYIWSLGQSDSQLKGMGTTLSVVFLAEGKAFVGHVGDSRIYLLQEQTLKQVSSDHSFVADMLREKKMTPLEAELSERKHYLTRAIGARPSVMADVFAFLLTGTRRMLLCSDGLSNMVAHVELERLLSMKNLDVVADELLKTALNSGGKDNISFIILDFEG